MSSIAEAAILGCIIKENGILDVHCGSLQADFFSNPQLGRLFAILRQMRRAGDSIDATSLAAHIFYHPEEKEYFGGGSIGLINQCLDAAISTKSAESYVQLIIEAARRRKAERILSEYKDAYAGGGRVSEITAKFISDLTAVIQNDGRKSISYGSELADSYLESLSAELQEDDDAGIVTGLHDIDKIIGRMRPGNLVVLAARPSMGKTSLALDIAGYVALQKKLSVMVASIEMSTNEVSRRLVSKFGGVELEKVMNPKTASEEDRSKMIDGAEKLSSCLLSVVDTNVSTVSGISAAARITKAKQGLDLLVIDHLQLMDDSDSGVKNQGIYNMVRYITRQLKLLAKDLNVPILLLSQLSRAVESRSDKRPMLSDLRDSGSVEQDADIVMMMYRPSYYQDNDNPFLPEDPKTVIMVEKNRNGGTGNTAIAFVPKYASFTQYTRMEEG